MQSTAAKTGTFAFQDQLPHLPVPTLEETTTKYLKTVKPLLLPEQYAATESAVAEFVKPGGLGEKLQARLIDRASKHKNWIYDWWNEAAYMAYRDPIVPYVSYFYSYKDEIAKYPHPSQRAAAIISTALEFKHQLDTETLEVDYMRKQPIDMELFRFLFNTCRIPEPGADDTAMYPTEGNEHIIVIRRNRFYKVPYVAGGRRLTTEELEGQLRQVYGDAELKGTGPNIGVLTSENRDVWVEMRDRLLAASPLNAESLKQIQSSAFVVCLDWAAPESSIERAHQYWHGYGRNRFYDKPAQFIVNDNGTAGFMGEHSMMDGTQTLRLNEFVLEHLSQNKAPLTTGVEYTEAPKELGFVVDDLVATDIQTAETSFGAQIAQHEVAVWIYEKYGKNLIKQFKVSPDAYIQMLLQIAYYRMNGRVRPVYESATTRKFAQGRTETTRSVSTESADMVAKFWDPSVSAADKIKAFRAAVNSQVAYIADATEGKGVDRHLFGLKRLLQIGARRRRALVHVAVDPRPGALAKNLGLADQRLRHRAHRRGLLPRRECQVEPQKVDRPRDRVHAHEPSNRLHEPEPEPARAGCVEPHGRLADAGPIDARLDPRGEPRIHRFAGDVRLGGVEGVERLEALGEAVEMHRLSRDLLFQQVEPADAELQPLGQRRLRRHILARLLEKINNFVHGGVLEKVQAVAAGVHVLLGEHDAQPGAVAQLN